MTTSLIFTKSALNLAVSYQEEKGAWFYVSADEWMEADLIASL